MHEKIIYFYDTEGRLVGSEVDYETPIPLFKGMIVSIHGNGTFRVVDWNYHHGYEIEKAGLRIILEQISESFEIPR